MGLLGGGGGRNWQNPSVTPYYTGLQIQTSNSNVPIAIVYGANKIAPNCFWTGGFYGYYGYPENNPNGGGGGKGGGGGGGGGGKGGEAWQYYTSWMMGLCEGPIAGLGTIWVGQNATNAYGADIWASYTGTQTQTPWNVLQTYWPSQALSYHGVAHIDSFNYYLGTSANLPQFAIEIFGILFNSSGINGGDADPAQIIQDFLTNSQYGVGFPAGSINAASLLSPASGPDSSYQGYCRASYLALSPVLTNQEAANSILARWLKLTNSAAVWSEGQLKIIPYGDSVVGPTPNQIVTGGSVTFTPNVTPVYNLGDDDFVHEEGKDPVEVTRIDPYACYNWQRLQLNERIQSLLPLNVNEPWVLWEAENSYVPLPVDVWDQNAIELYGLRMASDINANEICDTKVGQTAAQLILQRGLYIRNHYKFKLSWEYCLLDPMDLVTITDTALGMINVSIRIIEIEEDNSGVLAITAEEFPSNTATAVQYPVQPGGGNPTNQNVIPARVNVPVIFEPPAALTNNIPNVFIAVSGGVASAYLLAETAVTNQHFTSQSYASSITIPAAPAITTLTFSIYIQIPASNYRTALRLNVFNGSAQVGADFNFGVATPYATADAGVTATIEQAAAGSLWYQLTIITAMVASGTPILYVYLESTFGIIASYLGITGDGIYIWGQAFGWSNSDGSASEPVTFLPAFSTAVGATVTTNGVLTPEGTEGVADPNWGGANIWLSTDGNSYTLAGQVFGASRQGYLTANLGTAGGNPDTADTCSVSLVESGGALASVTPIEAQNGISLCLVDQELFSFETATVTGANAYNLTTLNRGLYGTTPATHSIGAPFVRVDNAVFEYPLPAGFIGVTIYVKLQSFNIFGLAVEDLSECTVYTYTPNGQGSPLGPVSKALAAGQSLDFGAVSAVVSESDQWGIVTDGFILAMIDLGAGT